MDLVCGFCARTSRVVVAQSHEATRECLSRLAHNCFVPIDKPLSQVEVFPTRCINAFSRIAAISLPFLSENRT